MADHSTPEKRVIILTALVEAYRRLVAALESGNPRAIRISRDEVAELEEAL